MALVALDEMERNASPLYSCQGEVLASRKDFRMNTCTPHPGGAFMLEPVGTSPAEALQPGKEAGRAEEPPVEAPACRSPVPVLGVSQGPGSSPEGPMPGGGVEDEDAEGVAELPEANDYTVDIAQQPGLEAAVDTMSLRLLTHQRAHTRFQTYAAPSMAQP
uniref:Condensin-2 complex subunit H2 n=1 Tax=Rousettus aegyptiacus TaxID=9407 RepID=A0A7J8JI97_ROUAE|nr:non-SMC condensin II complex subunit H2 [Rousettus aegyptiacus]